MLLNILPKNESSTDCLALGEVMLRLDPEENRIRRTNHFRVWEGGGEYNVVQGLSQCFGRRTGIITSLVDNEVGALIAGLIQRAGVDSRWINWVLHDGVGQQARNGLYFMEKGFGERGAKAVMDRGHTAIAQLQVSDIDWNALFADAKTRWFHVGGVMAALAEHSPQVVEAAMLAAKKHGAIVSYDLNYRASLWASKGGKAAAVECNERLIAHADVLFGIEQLPRAIKALEADVFIEALQATQARFPNLQCLVTTMRMVKNASSNDWGGVCLAGGQAFVAQPKYDLPIYDRVGGGDAFAAGFIHGVLAEEGWQKSIDLAVAHGALVMSTPGDNSMATLDEVYAYAAGSDASANR